MTPQEIFDTVVTHLAEQKKRASSPEGMCRYELPDGRRCAVGCIMNDSERSWSLVYEGCIASLVLIGYGKLRPFFKENLGLLTTLQKAHDDPNHTGVNGLKNRLKIIAHEYELDGAKVEDITAWDVVG